MIHLRLDRTPRRSAFTLMEVLVSIALLLALSGAMFTFVRDLAASRQRAETFTARQHAATTLIERLEHDLLFVLAGDAWFGAGLDGDEDSIRLLTRGVAIDHAAGNTSGAAAFSDLQHVEYRFLRDQHRLSFLREPVMRSRVDDRSEGEVNDQDDIDVAQGAETLATPIYEVRFRYHDGTAWRRSFNSLETGRLPAAVEVAIWFESWSDPEWLNTIGSASDEDDDLEPARLTFDAAAVFDEYEYAMRANRDFRADPPPDRIRVVAILDAQPPDEDDEDADDPFNETREEEDASP